MKRPVLRLVYSRILTGLPGVGRPTEIAARARASSTDVGSAADQLTAVHLALGSSQGFLFGVPGLLLLPVTLPANLAAAAAVQLHLSASIAALSGLRPEDPAVRDRCIDCLLREDPGGETRQEGEEIAVRTGSKLAERGARWAGGRLVRRLARSGLRRVGVRSVPFVGGLIGGVADGWRTRTVARCARDEFLSGWTAPGAHDGPVAVEGIPYPHERNA
jgi:hypothetical protein